MPYLIVREKTKDSIIVQNLTEWMSSILWTNQESQVDQNYSLVSSRCNRLGQAGISAKHVLIDNSNPIITSESQRLFNVDHIQS